MIICFVIYYLPVLMNLSIAALLDLLFLSLGIDLLILHCYPSSAPLSVTPFAAFYV